MKIIQRFFKKMVWIDGRTGGTPAKRQQFNTLVISRSQYQEQRRSYKVSLTDLYRVVQNECKVMTRPDAVVLWMILPKQTESYEVLFCSVSRALLAKAPAQIQLVVPETWLFYQGLQVNTLYDVEAEQNYWSFLTTSHQLHVTAQQGLMKSADYFLEALGTTKAQVETRQIQLPEFFQKNATAISWWQLLGLLCTSEQKSRTFDIKQWLPVGKIVSGVVLGYLVIASLALTWRENTLNQQVAALKQAASSLVDQQNKLDQQLELIDNYHQLFAKNVSYSEMLQLLGSQLQNIATIDSLSMTENLVIIRGTAKSATAVLAKLGEMPMWQESRFTQPVQTGNEVDVFVISTIYVPTKPLESKAQQQAPASMLEKSAETQP